MGFIPHKWHKGAEPWEVFPLNKIPTSPLRVGDAFVLSGGVLEAVAGSAKPEYISMQYAGTVVPDMPVHVERVRPETVYETELATAFTPNVGDLYAINGGKLVNDTVSGVAQVVSFDGTEAGSKVRVRFPD